MKKILSLIPIAVLICSYSSASFADRDGWRGEGFEHHHHGHHHNGYFNQPPMGYYPPPPVTYYQPPPVTYYPAPAVTYYPAQPRYRGGSPQGLAGGVVGSVLGYEMGNGDPIATGLGAVAGSFIGNGMAR